MAATYVVNGVTFAVYINQRSCKVLAIIRIVHKLVRSSTNLLTQLSWQAVRGLNDIHT